MNNFERTKVNVTCYFQKENCVVFAGGQMKPSPDKEPPNRQKKWAMPGIAQGNAVYIQDKLVSCIVSHKGKVKVISSVSHFCCTQIQSFVKSNHSILLM